MIKQKRYEYLQKLISIEWKNKTCAMTKETCPEFLKLEKVTKNFLQIIN